MNKLLALLIGSYIALTSEPKKPDLNFNHTEWHAYKLEHGKVYDDQEVDLLRSAVFFHNKHEVEQFNKHQAEELGFSLETNHLADRTKLELMAMNGFKLPEEIEERRNILRNSPESDKFMNDILNDDSIEVPESLDWRQTEGRVTQVKNQGQCGSCWAFASTGALEGQEKIRKTKVSDKINDDNLIELSEQNLVDCVTKDDGCGGGLMKDAFDFIQTEGGIDDEASYPYEAVTRKCRFNKDKVAFTDSGSAVLPTGDEQKLKEMVAKFGPVAVAIDASSIWFQLYHKGVYYNKRCKNKLEQLDHGVLVVGYGTDPKKGDYWIVKNSWGPRWGEKGYIRMARNKKNSCGIATAATIPTFSS